MNIFQIFQKTCQEHHAKTCVKFKNGEIYEGLTYGKLYDEVLRLRAEILSSGIKPGERVGLLMSNSPYWPTAFFAVISAQAVAVPIDSQLSPDDIQAILAHSGSKMLLTEDRFGVALGSVLSQDTQLKILFVDRPRDNSAGVSQPDSWRLLDFGPHKLAALFYTSGTTKDRKAVMLTHDNLLSNFNSIEKLGIIRNDDVIISLLPLHHTYPFMITCLVPLLKGACVAYLQSMVHYELFNAIRENKVTVFVGVPQILSLIERIVTDQMKKYGFFVKWSTNMAIDVCSILSSITGENYCKKLLKGVHSVFGENLRLITSGGAKLNPETARNFYRWGFRIVEGYGLTETSPVATFTPLNSSRFNSVGRAIPDVEVRVSDPQENGAGEIAVKGANVMLGYYRNLSMTRSVIKDGWFMTGDEGYCDKQGFLYLTGRKDELIVFSNGKKVNPEGIEAHYLKSPYIKEICVMEEPSPESGHLVAVIVPDEDNLKAHKYVNINFKIKWELDAYSQKLPPYQRVKGFVLTSEAFPRTRLGKLIRYKVAQRYSSGGFSRESRGAAQGQLSHFEEMAVKYLSKILKKDVKIDDHLELDLGLDSLGRIELLSALQDLVTVGIDDSLALELFQARTVRDLVTKARISLPEDAFLNFVKRDDTVFWPNVFLESLSVESQRRVKLCFDRYDRMVAILEILLLKLFFRSVFSLRVEGAENIPKDGPFVITPNHVSFLDAFYILCALPTELALKTYFVGFGAIFNHPLISWGTRFHRMIPIDADLNLAEALKACSYLLKRDKILVYFPEGQRSIDGGLKEFRKGAGILLKEANAKALPVYISGAYKAWPRTRAFPLPANITVKIGKVFDPAELKVDGVSDQYVKISDNLKAIVAELKGI